MHEREIELGFKRLVANALVRERPFGVEVHQRVGRQAQLLRRPRQQIGSRWIALEFARDRALAPLCMGSDCTDQQAQG